MHIENFTKPHIKVLLSLFFFYQLWNAKIACELDSFLTLPPRRLLGLSPKKTSSSNRKWWPIWWRWPIWWWPIWWTSNWEKNRQWNHDSCKSVRSSFDSWQVNWRQGKLLSYRCLRPMQKAWDSKQASCINQKNCTKKCEGRTDSAKNCNQEIHSEL